MNDYQKIYQIPAPYKITIYKRSETPNLYYYFSFNKKSYRGSCKTDTLEIAITRSTEKWIDAKRGKNLNKAVRIETIIKKYLDWKKPDISANTLYQYEIHAKYIKEKFKNKNINSFSKKDFTDYEVWRRKYYRDHKSKQTQKYKRNGKTIEGRVWMNIGNSTINREIGLLVSILRFAQTELELLQGQIVPGWKQRKEKRRDELLTKDEYERLKQYWLNKNPYYWNIISFVQNTGLRYPSEVNNLKWKDIKRSKNYIIIRNRKAKPNIDMPVPLVGTAEEIMGSSLFHVGSLNSSLPPMR
ncbi:MAG: tyrosine-type recombinase/integrase [Deltaproteobacteria bacterium]|nr:tyrosine-type recombinase/integrase [Deltaproteobacteria bacterium]